MNRKGISHPSAFIPASSASVLRRFASETETLGQLHADQLSVIYEQKWFNLYVPEEYGGLAMSLPKGLEIEEGLAWADGSVGWTVTLCSGANWFVGFLKKEISKLLFVDPKVCLAGSGRPSGIAKRMEKGYLVTGSWDYATGAPHATAFTANCIIEEGGSAVKNPDGSLLVRAFLFLRKEVRLENNWHVIGLIATASHRFHVQELEVSEDRCFIIDGDHVVLPRPIYKYPFLQLAETTLAVNHSGMAARFIEIGESILQERVARKNDKSTLGNAYLNGRADQEILKLEYFREAADTLQRLRQAFYEAVELSWQTVLAGQPMLSAGLEEVSRTSRQLATGARKLVDDLYPLCGLVAADPAAEINRVWRNLHTATQHSLLSTPVPANAGVARGSL